MTFCEAYLHAVQTAQGQTWRGEVQRILAKPVDLYITVFGNLIVIPPAFPMGLDS